jgi:hypothetical protein
MRKIREEQKTIYKKITKKFSIEQLLWTTCAVNHIVKFTVANWPEFRQNNLKETPKNISWQEKFSGRKTSSFFLKGKEKSTKNYYRPFFCKITIL